MTTPWNADVHLTETDVEQLITDQFPQLSTVTAELFAQGWDNFVFQVNGSFVFRFPRRDVAVECLEAEAKVLPRLAGRLSIPISAPKFIGQPTSQFPHRFLGYPLLPGKPVHMVPLSREQRTQSAVPFARFLKDLHHVTTEEAVAMGATVDTIGRLNVEKRMAQFEKYAAEAERIGLWEDMDRLRSVMNALAAAGPHSESIALVHGDLNFRNFLLDDQGVLSGVIDWGDVHAGDPAVDLAVVYSFLPSEARPQFFREYGPVAEERLQLALFRALYTSLYLLVYAHDIDDPLQLQEARTSLQLALENA